MAVKGFTPSSRDANTPAPTDRSQEVCRQFQAGKCKKGSKCRFKHVQAGKTAGTGKPADADAKAKKAAAEKKRKEDAKKAEERNRTSNSTRCRHDAAGRKCPHGDKCYFEHKNAAVNKPKPAKARDNSHIVCDGCGSRGHVAKECKKVKAHINDIKASTSFKGDFAWFRKKENSDKCKELIKVRGWFAKRSVMSRMWDPLAPDSATVGGLEKRAGTEDSPCSARGAPAGKSVPTHPGSGKATPSEYNDKWVDAGWCSVGYGAHAKRMRLFVDLGAAFSFGPKSMFEELKAKASAGCLGVAHVAAEMPQVEAESWDGRRRKCKNWMQLCIKANSVAGNSTTVVGQLISFDRDSEEDILVAGVDLAQKLGFTTAYEQQVEARAGAGVGVKQSDLLGEDPPPRSWVLSDDCKAKIERNRRLEEIHRKVRAEALAYVGDYAFNNVRSCDVVMEPLLAHSYVTSAVVTMAGESATRTKTPGVVSEFAHGHLESIGSWLAGEEHVGSAEVVQAEVHVGLVRVLRELVPLSRIKNVKFRAIKSNKARCVLGRDVLDALEKQDEDRQDPLQSEADFDEEQEVVNYLEAAFDRARLAGLPRKHLARYRKLIFETYLHVFRLRLGKEDPAILPPLKVETIPGAQLRKGYTIPFNLAPDALEELKKELDNNEGMGVMGNAPMGSTLHNLLTIKKVKGGYRWVITCVTANDITVDFHWFAPDNATEQQSRMKGARYFWLADMTKGYWQIQLDPSSRWLFCFATPFGAKQYLRAPMGSKATAPFFDMCMAKILDAAGLLRRGVEMIHDDHAGFADRVYDADESGRSHFQLLRRYLRMCSQHRLRVSPKKFEVFSTKADIAGL